MPQGAFTKETINKWLPVQYSMNPTLFLLGVTFLARLLLLLLALLFGDRLNLSWVDVLRGIGLATKVMR